MFKTTEKGELQNRGPRTVKGQEDGCLKWVDGHPGKINSISGLSISVHHTQTDHEEVSQTLKEKRLLSAFVITTLL